MLYFLKSGLCILLTSLVLSKSYAVEVRFPEEELESEYALPYFPNQREVVLSRRVIQKFKIGLSSSGMYVLDEPFYQPFVFNIQAFMYLTEIHGFGLEAWLSQNQSLSPSGKAFTHIPTKEPNVIDSLNVSFAPHPLMTFFLNYNYSPLYGKISLSKTLAYNIHIEGSVGVGIILMDWKKRYVPYIWTPAFQIRLNPKIYITKRIYGYGSIVLWTYQGKNPIDRALKVSTVEGTAHNEHDGSIAENGDPTVVVSRLQNTLFVRTLISVGVGILLF